MKGSLPPSSSTVGLISSPAMAATDWPAGSLPVSVAAVTRGRAGSARRRTRDDEQRLEHAAREAARAEHVGQIQRRLRHVGGVLEQADVARHQRGRGEPDGLPQREVPRHHGQHHPERLVAGVRGVLRRSPRRPARRRAASRRSRRSSGKPWRTCSLRPSPRLEGLAHLRVIIAAIWSRSSSSTSAAARNHVARCANVVVRNEAAARSASASLASSSSSERASKTLMVSPVDGLMVAIGMVGHLLSLRVWRDAACRPAPAAPG